MLDYFGFFERQWVPCLLIISTEHNMQIVHIFHVCLILTCPKKEKNLRKNWSSKICGSLGQLLSIEERKHSTSASLTTFNLPAFFLFHTFPIFWWIPNFLLNRPWRGDVQVQCETICDNGWQLGDHWFCKWQRVTVGDNRGTNGLQYKIGDKKVIIVWIRWQLLTMYDKSWQLSNN